MVTNNLDWALSGTAPFEFYLGANPELVIDFEAALSNFLEYDVD